MLTKKSIAVIGEGITEKFYVESLMGLTDSRFKILPQCLGLKASNLTSLEKSIIEAKEKGYDEVYCLIDMDTKLNGESKQRYLKLKNKYNDKILRIKNKGINCKVKFIETSRCTELWFLYHFQYTTRFFQSYEEVEKELRKYLPKYEKTIKYFKSIGSLDSKIIKDGGSRTVAMSNSRKSVRYRNDNWGIDCSFSEMFVLLEALGV